MMSRPFSKSAPTQAAGKPIVLQCITFSSASNLMVQADELVHTRIICVCTKNSTVQTDEYDYVRTAHKTGALQLQLHLVSIESPY